jgi:hypothetical protein
MSDWIDDMFDAVEGMIELKQDEIAEQELWKIQDRLLALLERCKFEDNVHKHYIDEILDSDLSWDKYQELKNYFDAHVLDVRYEYAPSQKRVAAFIRMISGLET